MKEYILTFNRYIRYVEEFFLVSVVSTMIFVLVGGAFMRFVLNSSLAFNEEIGSLMMISATYIGSPYAVRQSKHIRMVALSELGSFRFAQILNYFTCIIAAISFIVFGLMCMEYMFRVMDTGRSFMTLSWPRWIVWIPVCAGLIGTGVQYFIVFLLNVLDRHTITCKADIWVGSERRMGESAE